MHEDPHEVPIPAGPNRGGCDRNPSEVPAMRSDNEMMDPFDNKTIPGVLKWGTVGPGKGTSGRNTDQGNSVPEGK